MLTTGDEVSSGEKSDSIVSVVLKVVCIVAISAISVSSTGVVSVAYLLLWQAVAI